MYKRAELETLHSRIHDSRKHIQVIMGPRQVGKTTMVRQLCDDLDIPFLFTSADAVAGSDESWLMQTWESARLKKKTSGASEFLLIIDEVQKIINWSEVVKKLWDEDSFNKLGLKVILLGSSRLLLQQGLTESLSGRFEVIYLPHWSFVEMHKAFGWNEAQYAWFGGYPGSAYLIEEENRWKRYVRDSLIETSISKDILMLTRIDKPALLKNLFEVGCLYSGQILSYNKILGQLQGAGNTTTLSHYLHLLGTAGLLTGIKKYSHTTIRKRASSPKFQVQNNALLSAQSSLNFVNIQADPVEWGRVVESAVGAHLINMAIKEGFSLYYWRDRNDEVDFVLEYNEKTIGLEIKSNISKQQKGMEAFRRKFNPDKVYIIENRGLTWQELLKINPLELF